MTGAPAATHSDATRCSQIHPGWLLLTAGATFLLHALIALQAPTPGTFRKYNLAAEQFLSGELPSERLMDFSPFYFYLSLAAERLLPNPEFFLIWMQIALAAISVAMVFHLLARRFSSILALGATAVMALDRHLLVYERLLEPEIFLLFFLIAFLIVLDRRPLIAGVFAALCLATRPTFLPVFLLVPFYFWLQGARGRGWRLASSALLAPIVLILLLLAWRAETITGDPRTPMMNPGTVLFEGNNPLSLGTSAIYPPMVLGYVRHTGEVPDAAHQYYRDVARADTGRALTIAEVNAFWSSKVLSFIRAEPKRFVELLGAKLLRAFHGFRWHDIPLAWKIDQRLMTPAFPFALLAGLALVGTLFAVHDWRRNLLYYALGGSQLVVMLIFYVSARQRLVLLPALLYFAAIAGERLLHQRHKAWLWIVLVLLLTVCLSLPNDTIRDEHYRRTKTLVTEQRLEEVRTKSLEQPLALHADLAVAAVASAPWWLDWMRPAYFPRDRGTLEQRVATLLSSSRTPGAPSDFDLGMVHLAAGQLTAAREILEPLSDLGTRVYRGGRQPSDPSVPLATAIALAGQPKKATEILKRALEKSPGDPFILAELIALTDDPSYQQPLLDYWSRLDAQYLLGRALLRHGRPTDAVLALGFVTNRLPDFRDAKVLLAAALGETDRLDEGSRQYFEATQIRLEPILAGDQITSLFRRWLAANPGRAEVRFFAARVLHQNGHFAEALSILDSLDPPPDLADPVAKEKQRIRAALGN